MTEIVQNPMTLSPQRHGSARRTTFGYETDDHPRLDKIQNTISMVAGTIAGTAIVLMVVLACAEVFFRIALGQPLGWNVSFTERYLLTATAFFGIVTAYRSGAHVAVTSIFGALPFNARKTLLILTHVLIAVIFALVFWFGLQATMTAFTLGEIPPKGSSELPLHEWIWRSFIPVSSLMAFTIAVIDLYRELTAPWGELATDYDPGDLTGAEK